LPTRQGALQKDREKNVCGIFFSEIFTESETQAGLICFRKPKPA